MGALGGLIFAALGPGHAYPLAQETGSKRVPVENLMAMTIKRVIALVAFMKIMPFAAKIQCPFHDKSRRYCRALVSINANHQTYIKQNKISGIDTETCWTIQSKILEYNIL